jgi:hypothetical protein
MQAVFEGIYGAPTPLLSGWDDVVAAIICHPRHPLTNSRSNAC